VHGIHEYVAYVHDGLADTIHCFRREYDLVTSVSRNHPRGTERERGMGPGAQKRRLGWHGPAHRRRSKAYYKNGECYVPGIMITGRRSPERGSSLLRRPAAQYVVYVSISGVHPVLPLPAVWHPLLSITFVGYSTVLQFHRV